ncbi:MAG: invasion associated locus B family protein [Alphaproteobacteria bacterium]
MPDRPGVVPNTHSIETMSFNFTIVSLTAALLCLFLASPVQAQNPHGQIFDAWRVQCNSPTGAPAVCQMFQNIVVKDSGEPVLRFFVGYQGEGETPIGVLVVPLGVHLPSGITLKIDDGQAYELTIEVCLPNGCRARFGFDRNFLDLFKQGSNGTVSFVGGNRQPFNVPISLIGFTAALKAIR